MADAAFFNPAKLIEEIKKRPCLYKCDQPADRAEKLLLWKEIGAALYSDWDTYNKATAYDKVLQLQRKWRSLRDAYNRELRARRTDTRTHRTVYKYFKRMSFLGGFTGSISDENSSTQSDPPDHLSMPDETIEPEEQLVEVKPKKPRRKQRKRRSTSDSIPAPKEMEMQLFPMEIAANDAEDSDKLFMMSFLPEMRQLPPNLRMWARAQIANVMQEAVNCHYTNTQPGETVERNGFEVKRSRRDSSE